MNLQRLFPDVTQRTQGPRTQFINIDFIARHNQSAKPIQWSYTVRSGWRSSRSY
ncbi:MAG: hypothetical protein KME57_16975 [Scytonema hyalinum WJT4-NPBG1]|jgi:hypothetical protein|nr:hypothetical protein [Scytonema hyalinum WJT4-NPBG1]